MKKSMIFILTLLLTLSLLAGCGASTKVFDGADAAYSMNRAKNAYAEDAVAMEAPMMETAAPAAEAAGNESVSSNRKLIKRVSLSLETEGYSELLDGITQRVTRFGGYIEEMDANTRYDSHDRYAYMTVRIPVDKLDSFITSVSGISNVVQRSESTEDVTLTYVDMESHRDALKIEQERLMALLEQADTMTDILDIENRLTQVRYELESMESTLRSYDNLIEYATVSLSISEVRELTPVAAEKGFWEKIGDGFVRSAKAVWEFLKDAFSLLIIAIPYLLIVALAVVLILIFCRIGKKRRIRKRERKAAQHRTESDKTE